MLFQAVMKFLSRLVEFKILVNWGMIHSLRLSKVRAASCELQVASCELQVASCELQVASCELRVYC
jgi:hypothetical protein